MGSIRYKISKEIKLIHFIGEGLLSFEYIIEEITNVRQDSQWNEDFSVLIDFENAQVDYLNDGLEHYQQFIHKIDLNSKKRKWAIYTKNNTTHQNANMNHFGLQKNLFIKVFNTLDESLDFLGVNVQSRNIVTCFREQK